MAVKRKLRITMKDLINKIEKDFEVEAVDVTGKVVVLRTNTIITPENLQILQKFYQEKGAMGVIVMRKDDRIELLTKEQLEHLGFKATDFLAELEEIE
jgi:hypothetical protein